MLNEGVELQTGVVIVVLMISGNSSIRDDASLLSVPAVEKSQTDVLLFLQ